MIKKKTVLVLGAGASKEVGLPTGAELKKTIKQKLGSHFDRFGRPTEYGDPELFDELRRSFQKESNDYLRACRDVHNGIMLAASIDDFIDNHQDNPKIAVCGKLTIARAILEAERNSLLFFDAHNGGNTINWELVENTWLSKFYRLATKGMKKKTDLHSIFDNVTFINFNYDRCLEHYLVHALAAHQSISQEDAIGIVQKIKIFRPYGKVGVYFNIDPLHMPFGSERVPRVEATIKDLRTYTEQMDDKKELESIHNSLQEAEAILFLGSAYHENNIKLLTSKHPKTSPLFFATKKGIPKGDLSYVAKRLSVFCSGGQRPKLNTDQIRFAESCQDLFDEYRMSLGDL